MPEGRTFERDLEARLQARAARATRPFDAAAIARRAAAPASTRVPGLRALTLRSSSLAFVIIGLLLAAAVAAIAVAAGLFSDRPSVTVVLPTQSSDAVTVSEDPALPAVPTAHPIDGWPGPDDRGAGLYSWDFSEDVSMCPVEGGGLFRFHLGTLAYTEGDPVVLLGHPATSQEFFTAPMGSHREEWIFEDLAGKAVVMTLKLPDGGDGNRDAEAQAMISSLRLVEAGDGASRLVLAKPAGWRGASAAAPCG